MPEKPKRPMSAFFLWLGSHRAQIKAQHSELSSAAQIAKKAGEMWRSTVDKKEWEEKAQKLMEQYRQDLAEYKARHSEGPGCPQKRRRFTRARSSSSSDDSSD